MRRKLFLVVFAIMCVFVPSGVASALTTTQLYNNAANNILFYVKDGEDACNPSEMAEYVPTVTGDQITWIGDAWSVFAKKVIGSKYPGVSLFAEDARPFSGEWKENKESGTELAKRLAEGNALRKYVVFMLGVNGGNDNSEDEVKAMISDLLGIIGDERMLVLMTPYTRHNQYENFGKAVKSVSEDNDKVLLVDWASEVKDKIDLYFNPGQNSLNETGVNMLVSMVKGTLDAYTSSTSQKATSTVGATTSVISSNTTSVDTSSVESRMIYIANVLRGKGYDAYAIAGILGNLGVESCGSFDGKIIQGCTYLPEEKRNSTWKLYDYANHKDNYERTYKGTGFGIAQWTYYTRQAGLQEFADKNGSLVYDLETQVGFMLQEMSGRDSVSVANLNGKNSVETTVKIFMDGYEQPGIPHEDRRVEYAKSALGLIEANGIAKGSGLQWSASGGAGISGAICSENMQGGAGLAQLAVDMAWPNEDGTCLKEDGSVATWKDKWTCAKGIKAKNKEVMQKVYGAGVSLPDRAMDCSHFIYALVQYSGLDNNWPDGSYPAWKYANSEEGQKLWTKIENLENTSNLMPGDIFTYPRNDSANMPGHVMMYIGEYGKDRGNAAMASLNNYVASIVKNIYYVHSDTGMGAGTKFTISRYNGGGTVNLGSAVSDDYGDVGSADNGDAETEEIQPSENNECGGNTQSKGVSYKDEMTDSKLQDIGKVIQNSGCNSTASCRAYASFLANRYEHLGSPGGDVHKWIVSNYTKVDNGGHDLSNGSNALLAAKYVFNSKGATDGKGNRTLAGNVYEMTKPTDMNFIKIDGTTGSRPSILTNDDYAKLKSGTSKGTKTGYTGDLDFYCAVKDSAGNYKYLFWSYNKTPKGQETR